MALFEEITAFAGTAVLKGKKLTRNTGKLASLKFSNYTAQNDISRLYGKIGERYYQKHGLAPEAGFEELCDKVTELKTLLNSNEAAINEIRIDGVIDEVVVDPED